LELKAQTFEEIFSEIPQPAVVYDAASLKFIAVNDEALKLYGFSKEEFLRMKLEDIERVKSNFITDTHSFLISARQYVKKDHSTLYAKISVKNLTFGEGNAVLMLIDDITEEKKFEQRLSTQYAVVKIAAESSTIEEAIPKIIDSICTGLGCDVGEYWKYDEQNEKLLLTSHWSSKIITEEKYIEIRGRHSFKKGEGLPGIVWKKNKLIWNANLSSSDLFINKQFLQITNLKSAAAFPVYHDSNFYGVMVFFSLSDTAPDSETEMMFNMFGRQIGNFIYQKNLAEEKDQLLMQIEKDKIAFKNLVDNIPGIVWEMRGLPGTESQDIRFVSVYAETMFGYPVKDWLGKSTLWFEAMHPEDRQKAVKNAERIIASRKTTAEQYRFYAKDGTMIWTELFSSAILDESNQIIGRRGVLIDITAAKNAEEVINFKIEQQKAIAELGKKALEGTMPSELMKEVIDLVHNFLVCNYISVLEYIPAEEMFLLKAGAGWQKGLVGNIKFRAGNNSQAGYTFLTGEPVVVEDMQKEKRFTKHVLLYDKNIASGISVIIHGKGNPYGVLSAHSTDLRKFGNDDIQFLTAIANIIATSIERKKFETDLELSIKQKEVLLREVHHRVKNNLQVISSLLSLQSKTVKDPESLELFNESQRRIKSMALIHEKLYRSRNFLEINFGEYVNDLTNSLFTSYAVGGTPIIPLIEISDIYMNVETAVPLGLIINELTSNSLKYAFRNYQQTGKRAEIKIEMKESKRSYTLLIKDNGSGLPENFNFREAATLGLQLVTSLVDQLNGKIELGETAGTEFVIVIPKDKKTAVKLLDHF